MMMDLVSYSPTDSKKVIRKTNKTGLMKKTPVINTFKANFRVLSSTLVSAN